YLPVKEPERSRAIRSFEKRAHAERQSQIFIEAPYRNAKLLETMLGVLSPSTLLTVAADITSASESISTMRVEQWRKVPMPDIQKRPTIFILGI
ncbi:MAG: SAM-dependent methyltransferase, partial [Alistipes sp.]|nr:SAM-dependent methyltransferase [Alistipes sp.]